MIKNECKGKIINSKVVINERKFLETIEKNSIGGVILTSNRGRIVCSNTLLNRVNLAFQESLPDIRKELYSNDN